MCEMNVVYVSSNELVDGWTVKQIRELKKVESVVEVDPVDLRMLFYRIEDAFLFNDFFEGDLYDIFSSFLKEKGYIILKKADK